MTPRTLTMVPRPPSLRGVPPRYPVFDRRKNPPMTVGRFYADPGVGGVVFEVYEDELREFLKREPALRGKRFAWMLDVDPDAPGDTISALVRPEPMPVPEPHGAADGALLSLADALAAFRDQPGYRVIHTSDPV